MNTTESTEEGHRHFIFLAEDDLDDQELLIETINDLDPLVCVKAINNGKKAIQYLQGLSEKEVPCLIVVDYNLPELSGAEVLESLQPLHQFTNVTKIVWSTSNSPVFEKICIALGAKAYLVKPNDISGIERMAHLLLEFCKKKRRREM